MVVPALIYLIFTKEFFNWLAISNISYNSRKKQVNSIY